LKIGIFTDSFRPYTSGVVRSIELFTQEYLKKGHQVYIFGPGAPFSMNKWETHEHESEDGVYRFFAVPVPTFSEYAIPIPVSPQLRATVKKIGLDIIHAHSPFLMGRLGARAAKIFNIPLVFTFHTLYDQYVHYMPLARSASRKVVRVIARDFCNRSDLVIAPSSPVRKYMRKIGVKTGAKVIPTGIDLNEFNNTNNRWLRDNYQIREHEKILLFVGRLGKEKNVVFLLKAFKKVLQHHPHARMVMVGSGPMKNELIKFARSLNIEDKIIFTGLLPRNKVVHCYASADIFTFPSVTETQGLVIGEAKACGLPTVAINAFGTPDMVKKGEDGFLCSPSLEDFSSKVIRLLKDEELYRKMSQNARENSVLLSSSYCADLMLAEYEKLAQTKTAPGSRIKKKRKAKNVKK